MAHWTQNGSPLEKIDTYQSLCVDTLVVQAQHGDQQAFEILYERYNGQINTYLSRMVGDDGVGCELTQEAFLKAWSALPGLRTPAFFVGWLYRIALNSARNYQKRVKQVYTVPLDTYTGSGAEPSVQGPEEGFAVNELLQLALTRVAPLHRSCLILYVIEELPQQQIAERLNIKVTCVSKYVSRGKEELRQVYNQLLKGQSSTLPKRRKS